MSENEGESGSNDVTFGTDLSDPVPTKDKPTPKKLTHSLDGSVKRDVAFLQKKVADVEIAISEVQESIQKIDVSGLEDLKQRVEDIEDLTMVENAGIIELKKTLDEINTKTEQNVLLPELTEKINNLEQKITMLPNLTEVESKINEFETGLQKIGDIEQKIASLPGTGESEGIETPKISELEVSLQTAKDEFQNKLNDLDTVITDLEAKVNDTAGLREEIKNQIIPLIPQIPDFSVIKKNLEDSVTSIRMDVEGYKNNIERIKKEIEEKINSPLQSKLLKEFEEIKNDSLVNNSKVDAVDSFVKELAKEVSDLSPLISRLNNKVENLDGLAELENTIDAKLSEFKDVLDTAEAIKRGVEPFKEIDQVLSRFRDVERKLSEMQSFIENFEKSKEDILSLRWKTDYKKLVEDMNKRFDSLRKEMELTAERGSKPSTDYGNKIADIQETLVAFDKKIESFNEELSSIGNDMSVFQGSLMSLEQNRTTMMKSLEDLRQIASRKQPRNEMAELIGKIDSLEAEINNMKSLNLESMANEIVRNMNNLENKVDAISASAGVDEQLSELVSRLVFVESRLAAMESMIQDMPRYSPIVVE